MFTQQNSIPEDFIAAWRYVHRLFDKAGADKVIWVWSPPDTASVTNYFPGKQFVDWLSIGITKPAITNAKYHQISFDSLYRPFHLVPLFKSGLPIMVINKDGYASQNARWWNAAWNNIDTAFTEIKSVLAFTGSDSVIGGKTNLANTVKAALASAPLPTVPLVSAPFILPSTIAVSPNIALPVLLKSIVYDKGYYWFRNRHTMGVKTLQADVTAMKEIGINTIERTMPGFYDNKLAKILVKNQMNLIPRFWMLGTPEMVADDKNLQTQKEKILALIKENLNKKYIIAWSLGDDVLFSLSNQLFKPDYFYYQQKYVLWLADVTREIRLLDKVRPILMDLQWNEKGQTRFEYYKQHVPLINKYMLVADVKYKKGLASPLMEGMAWGRVAVDLWPLVPALQHSGTIPAWQDIENTDFITINGLLDLEGRKKQWYREVKKCWGGLPTGPSPIPDIKILKPAKDTRQNTSLVYHIIYKKDNTLWRLFDDQLRGIRFEWYLVRTDQYGNTMFIKKAGVGESIALPMPADPQYYELHVEAILGDNVKMVSSTLNTPL